MSNVSLNIFGPDIDLAVVKNSERTKPKDNDTCILTTDENFDKKDIEANRNMPNIRQHRDKQNRVSIMDEKHSANHEREHASQPQENIGTIQVDSKPKQVNIEYPQSEISVRENAGKHQSINKNCSKDASDHILSQENHNNPDTNYSNLSNAIKDADNKCIPIHPQEDFGQLTGSKDSILTQTSQFIPHNEISEMVILRRKNINDDKDKKLESNGIEALKLLDIMFDKDDKTEQANSAVDQPVNNRCYNKSTSGTDQEIEITVTEDKTNHAQIDERKAEDHEHPMANVNQYNSENQQLSYDPQRENQNNGYLKCESNENESKQNNGPAKENIDIHAVHTNCLKVAEPMLDQAVKTDQTNFERIVTEDKINNVSNDESKAEDHENEQGHSMANVNKWSFEVQQLNYDQQRENQNKSYLKYESNVNKTKQKDGQTNEITDNCAVVTNDFNVSNAMLDTDVETDTTNIADNPPMKYRCCNELPSETEPEIEINLTETKNNHGLIAEEECKDILHLSQISEKNLQAQTSDIEDVNNIEHLNKCSSEDQQFTNDSSQGNRNRGYLNHEFKQKENTFCEWSKDYPRYNAITNASKLISEASEFKELTKNAEQYIHIDTMSGITIVGDNIYIYHYDYCQYVLIRGGRKYAFTKMSRFSLVMTANSLFCSKQTAWLFEEVDNPKSISFCAEMTSVVIYAVPYLPISYLDLALYFNRPVERENRNSATGELLDPFRIGNTVSTLQDHAVSNRDDGTMLRSGATSIVAVERRYHFLQLVSYFQRQGSNLRAQHRYRPLNHTQIEPSGMRLPQLSETVSYEGRSRTRVVVIRPEASGRSHNTDNEIQTGTRTSQHSDIRVTIVDPEATERRHNTENELPTGALVSQGSDTLISAEQFGSHVTVLPPSESRPITETLNQTFRTPETQGSDTLTPAERSESRVTVVPPSGNRPLTETENHTESSACGSSGHRGTEPIMFCRYCYANVIAVMFLPCEHAVCCKDCSKRFTVCDECTMPIKKKRSLN